jgi:two-component system, response regulator PdtaR
LRRGVSSPQSAHHPAVSCRWPLGPSDQSRVLACYRTPADCGNELLVGTAPGLGLSVLARFGDPASWAGKWWGQGMPAEQAESGQRPVSILVVENDPLVRISVADHLRSVGYQVVEAGTADEAVSALSSSRIHLVFSDVDLPGTMGGFSLAVWVRHHYRSLPVILTSGVNSAMLQLNRQHIVPFLPKPYRPEEAADLIADILARR